MYFNIFFLDIIYRNMILSVLVNSYVNKCVFKINGFIFKMWEDNLYGDVLNFF